MPGKYPHPLIEFFTQVANLLSVFRYGVLLPAIGHRFEQGNQRGRCGQNYPLGNASFNQTGVLLQGRTKKNLPR